MSEPGLTAQSDGRKLPQMSRSRFVLRFFCLLRNHPSVRYCHSTGRVNLDEAYHIAAGASYAQRGDFRINPEHPPNGPSRKKMSSSTTIPILFEIPPVPSSSLCLVSRERSFQA